MDNYLRIKTLSPQPSEFFEMNTNTRNILLTGSIPALITPFESGSYHPATLRKLIQWHIEQASRAIVVCGTTGESPTLDLNEYYQILVDAVKYADKKIDVIAGITSNSTNKARQLQLFVENAGASASLHATGYFNNPTEHQIVEHYRNISLISNIPIIVYHIPARTGTALSEQTIYELSELKNIIGIKDSTGKIERVSIERKMIKKGFSFLSGDDSTCLGYMAHGGNGCISVTANVAPDKCSKMIKSALQGDFTLARKIHDELMPLHEALFLEPSPAGIKYAMSRLGLCKNELRQPMTPVSPKTAEKIDEALSYANLI